MPQFSTDAEACAELIVPKMIGARIIRPVATPGGDAFGFVIRHPDETEQIVWVDSDAEGNGAGFLTIEDLVVEDQ